jgi:hypothetical protein
MAASVTNMDWAPAAELGQSQGERALTLAAMAGAVGGAVGGAAWAADAGLLAVVCGTLGTMFGSGVAAAAGFLAARLWSRRGGPGRECAGLRNETVAAR